MIPKIKNPILCYSFDVIHKRVTQTIVNHVPTNDIVQQTIRANIQPLKASELTALNYDVSLRYIRLYDINNQVSFNDIIEYAGRDYRIINVLDYNDYGYVESHGEEVKE